MGPGYVPLALACASCAALLGIPPGLVVWALYSFWSRKVFSTPLNPWFKIVTLIVNDFQLVVMGATMGVVVATSPADYAAALPALDWGLKGACLGLAATVGGWLLVRPGRHRPK